MKTQTNVQFLTALIKNADPLLQMFIVESLGRYADQVAAAAPLEHGFIDGRAWKRTAQRLGEQLATKYGNRAAEQLRTLEAVEDASTKALRETINSEAGCAAAMIEAPRVIHVWNTGRAYTKDGQIIAATIVPDKDGRLYWLFFDCSRNVQGAAICHLSATRTGDAAQARTEVMHAYDLDADSWESYCYLCDSIGSVNVRAIESELRAHVASPEACK